MVRLAAIAATIAAASAFDFSHFTFVCHDLFRGSMYLLLENRLGLECLKFGSEIPESLRAAVGATSSIGQGITAVLRFVPRAAPGGSSTPCYQMLTISCCSPIPFATTILLGLAGISISRA